MNDLLFNVAQGKETDFPSEQPTEPNPHIPEHKPKEEPIPKPEPQIPEFDPKKPMPIDPSAPEGGN